MTTAKLFFNGRSQAVRLPREFRFEGAHEVLIKRHGGVTMLIPKNKLKTIFMRSLAKFPDDFTVDRTELKPPREVDL